MTRLRWILSVFVLVAGVAVVSHGQQRKPVYIGARACAACHEGKGIGSQYSLWMHSKHAIAYAALFKPESREITAMSGLRQQPQDAAICLGCHSTAFSAEEWEKDEGFRKEDGVQCEACHGPGSEYSSEEVMRNKAQAMKLGLRFPSDRDCENCHIEKGTHVAVLHSPPVDIKKNREKVAHPLPQGTRTPGTIPDPAADADKALKGPKYVGTASCGKCHSGYDMGNQYSVWRMSPHFRAWSVLATPAGLARAKKDNIDDPQKSPACLKCHSTPYQQPGARAASFTIEEGVGCEACHGPGSDYMHDAIMRDKTAAVRAGLKAAKEGCKRCHRDEKFDVEAAFKKIAHPTKLPPVAEAPRYKNPLRLALTPDARELWVTCETGDSVIVVDRASRRKVAEIALGGNPTGITFAPDGKRAYITNRLDNTLSVVDVASRSVVQTVKVGTEPHGLVTDKPGKNLYVLNTSSNDITVLDTATLKPVRTLGGGNNPWSIARSPDGNSLLVTNALSRFTPIRTPYFSEVTQIDAERGFVEERRNVPGANLMLGIDWHPSGKFAFATLNRTKNLVPMTRLLQGWTITNGLAVLWRHGRTDEVLLDEPDLGFADATDLAFTPDGRYALVTSSGTNRVAVVDVNKVTTMLEKATPEEREHVLPNHLGKPTEFIVKHIPTRDSPRGVVVAPDGRFAYVANSLDDSLTVIDMAKLDAVDRIDLGGPKEITKIRFGERLFHSANITFHKQFACHSCHPDGHVDGLAYDIEADGIGISPVDNRTLRGIYDTAPFKWEGTNPTLRRQCGPRLAVFFTRLAPFTPEQLDAVDYYISHIQRPPNRYRSLGADLSPAQRRGKVVFERTRTNDGREIPENGRCVACHFPPYYTDRRIHDVGTKLAFDRTGKFDVPHLNNIYDSAPYLHNGMAATLEEIWTVYNPNDTHGVTNDMTKDQLNDLIEFLKTL